MQQSKRARRKIVQRTGLHARIVPAAVRLRPHITRDIPLACCIIAQHQRQPLVVRDALRERRRQAARLLERLLVAHRRVRRRQTASNIIVRPYPNRCPQRQRRKQGATHVAGEVATIAARAERTVRRHGQRIVRAVEQLAAPEGAHGLQDFVRGAIDVGLVLDVRHCVGLAYIRGGVI